jgi:hypothetical protein
MNKPVLDGVANLDRLKINPEWAKLLKYKLHTG